MKLSIENIKALLKSMDFLPQDGVDNIYYKKYNSHKNYIIRVNFITQKIEYRGNGVKTDDGIKCGDLTTSNFDNSENFVVLECVNRLLEKGYIPKNLYLEYKFPLGRNEKGKLDILVFDNDEKAYLMIECKTWGAEFSKEEKKMLKDGGQLFSYYVQDKATKYLCLYTSRLNNNKIEYKNHIIKVDEVWAELTNQKEIHDHWNKNTKDNGVFEEWANAYDVEIKALVRSRLLPLTKDDSGRIFNQFAEILRHNVVSDKPNAFNKILNLFICKIIDEDKNDNEQVEFQWMEDDTDEKLQLRLNDLYKKGMYRFLNIDVTDFTETDISDTLDNIGDNQAKQALRDIIIKLRLQKNPEFAFVEVYDEASFKLNARIVKEVVELLQPYQFRYGHKQQFLGDFFELLLNTSIKQEAGQFFTPVPIARYIIYSLPIKEMIESKIEADEADILPTVIDFACGTGHFLTEYMDRVQNIIENDIDSDNAKRSVKKKLSYWSGEDGKFEWASDYVYGIDADYRLVKSTKVNSFLNGDGEANIIRANGLDSFSKSKDYRGKLRLATDSKDNGQFDILIANPPYSVASFKSTVKNGETSFDLFKRLTDNSSEIECLFIERMKQLLRVGGYAGIVLPSSVFSNSGIYTPTREIILKYFKIVGVTELGSNTFMATGTNTIILFLERRANFDSIHIQNAINRFFEAPKDVTVLGIEKAFTKYVLNIFDNITLDDYISFVNKSPTSDFRELEIYNDYINYFESLTEVKNLKKSKSFKDLDCNEQNNKLQKLFYEKIFAIEKDKMLYFLLTFTQKTLVTSVGEKQAEKEFLGYEFSTRRGHEGIKMLESGTKLYDEDNPLNSEKANSYIYHAFLNKYYPVDETISKNICQIRLSNMIDFLTTNFEKAINLKVSEKVEFETSLNSLRLDEIADFQDGLWEGADGDLVTVNVIRNTNFKLNNGYIAYDDVAQIDVEKSVLESRRLCANDIILEKSGGSPTQPVGRVVLFDKCTEEVYSYSNFCTRIRVTTDLINPKYLWLLLNLFYNLGGTKPLQNGMRLLNLKIPEYKKIKIPCPDISIQNQIVKEITSIEQIESKYIELLQSKKEIINKKMNNMANVAKECLNEKIVTINSSSIQPEKTPDKKFTYVDIDSVENGTGRINYKKKIAGANAPSRARRLAKSNSTIISTVRPNLKAFAYIDKEIEDCVYSTGFSILESIDKKKLLSKWVYYNFMYSNDLMEQMLVAMPKGQYPSINNEDIKKFTIPLPSVDIQKEIISEIEAIEESITEIESKIAKSEQLKKEILQKYLN